MPLDAVFFRHHSAEQELQQSPVVSFNVSAHFTLVVDRLEPSDRGALHCNGFEVISRGALTLFEGGVSQLDTQSSSLER